MANMWSIRIVTLPDGTVAFQPDIPGAQPDQPLGAQAKDVVTWNNQTNGRGAALAHPQHLRAQRRHLPSRASSGGSSRRTGCSCTTPTTSRARTGRFTWRPPTGWTCWCRRR